jgi:hypothetical protein
MAEKFACDPQEVELVARELTRMRSDLQLSVPHPLEGASVASEPIDAALSEFVQAVTASRTALIAQVGATAGLFAGLSEGTLDLDQAFADRAMEM